MAGGASRRRRTDLGSQLARFRNPDLTPSQRAAACIVGWHLNEARRLLADLDTPALLAAAIRLDSWMRNEAIANDTDRVPAKRIYQQGRNCVRDSRQLRTALAILAERGRARMEEDGRRGCVAINPVLLDERE